jgi:hypothetical protein
LIDCGKNLSKGNWQEYRANSLMTYYANQESGIGVWVGAAELFPSPIALSKLRQKFGQRWQPPQQIQQLTDDQIEMALNIATLTSRQPNRALRCQGRFDGVALPDTGYRHGRYPITNIQ